MKKIIKISKPVYTCGEGTHRVSAQVNDETLWFESEDIELRPAPEAFVSALLIPALNMGADIEIDAVVSSIFLSNMTEIMKIFKKWWGFQPAEIRGSKESGCKCQTGTKTALCFSGGVDSFFTLLRKCPEIDYLVFVHGYGIFQRV